MLGQQPPRQLETLLGRSIYYLFNPRERYIYERIIELSSTRREDSPELMRRVLQAMTAEQKRKQRRGRQPEWWVDRWNEQASELWKTYGLSGALGRITAQAAVRLRPERPMTTWPAMPSVPPIPTHTSISLKLTDIAWASVTLTGVGCVSLPVT